MATTVPGAESHNTYLSAEMKGHNWVILSVQDEQRTGDVLHTVGERVVRWRPKRAHLYPSPWAEIRVYAVFSRFLFTIELRNNFLGFLSCFV